MSGLPGASQNSSDYFDEDDSSFLEALSTTILPGDVVLGAAENENTTEDSTSQELEAPPPAQPIRGTDGGEPEDSATSQELEPPPPAQPLKRKRSLTPLEDEIPPDDINLDGLYRVGPEDETYGAATFGGFGEYMRRKRAKLQIQNAQVLQEGGPEGRDGVKSQIFKGLAIYINGHTRPSVQDLRLLILQHGGTFQPYLDKKALVTHIITCSLTPAKIREFKHMKVVRPEWLVESVEKGFLLPWKSYIYTHEGRIEHSQGAKTQQMTLVDQPKESSNSSSSTSNKPHGTSSAIKSASDLTFGLLLGKKSPPPVDPLYTTDPVTKADAARVPGYAADKSNPNAQRAMANPDWRKAHTSASSGFIEGYYKNSRLHHLSTWKSELKNLVQEAQERAENSVSGHVGKVGSEATTTAQGAAGVSMRGAEFVMRSPSSKWKGKAKVVEDEERVIMHCDFDCFFVSAGLVSRPELKGKPVVVCHSQGTQGGASSTSEIASSSYEARKFGIKNGMSLQQARQLCPGVITIPYEFERYKQFSLLFYTVLMCHADDLQAVSVDEALIDVTTTVNQLRTQVPQDSSLHDPAKDFAEKIRSEVRKATTCEVSIGISHNVLLARLATRRAKPGGSFHLGFLEVPEFLAPLDISDLHGFGWSTKQKAQEKLGTTNLGELAKKSKAILMDALGKGTGEILYKALRGIDEKKLESDKPRKSVSCEINYGIRFENNEEAEAFIQQMAVEVKKRLDAIDMVGRSITLKIMKRDPTAPVEPPKFLGHGRCDLFNKQMPLIAPGGKATNDDQIIGEHAWRLLKSFNFDPRELRGLGIQVQKLESSSSSTNAPPGQAVLSFRPKVGSSKGEPQINVEQLSQEGDTIMGDPVKPSTVTFDLPSFSQVDRSVFDALPRDVREELESEYKRRSASPFVSRASPAAPANEAAPRSPGPFGKRSNTPSVFPPKPFHKGPNVKRITQQLAPRSRASISPHKSALYQWAMRMAEKEKKKQAAGVRITDAALLDLKLDPEVFKALPTKVQREQLIMARIIKDKGRLPEPPKERKVLKPKKHELPPDFVPYRAPKPKARYIPPPFLRQQGKTKKEKLYFTETDDIQRIVETWVNVYRHWAPKEKDVEFLAKFIVQSTDRAQASDVGVERAVAIMKWWIVLLRRFFPASEVIEEEDLALSASQRNLVGEAWWGALHGIQDQMDAITRKRFGGRLSLR